MKRRNFYPERLLYPDAYKIITSKIDTVELLKKIKNNFFNRRVINSISRLILELKCKFLEYDTILSDDVGGRIPSLIFYYLINKKRKEEGRPPIKIYFLACSANTDNRTNALWNFLYKKKECIGKALVVTEYISSGTTISRLTHLLESVGINFDIASVSINDEAKMYPQHVSKRLYYGDVGDSGEDLYSKREEAGVEKNYSKENPHPELYPNYPMLEKSYYAERISSTRDDIKVIADELFKLLD